jgi:hypothetical protein
MLNRILSIGLPVTELVEKRFLQAVNALLITHRPTVELLRTQPDVWLRFEKTISIGAMR